MDKLIWVLLMVRIVRLVLPFVAGLVGGLLFLGFFLPIVPGYMVPLMSVAVGCGLASGLWTALSGSRFSGHQSAGSNEPQDHRRQGR